MPRDLVNKVGNMQEKMDSESREMETLRKNQKTQHIIILESSLVHIQVTLPHKTTIDLFLPQITFTYFSN